MFLSLRLKKHLSWPSSYECSSSSSWAAEGVRKCLRPQLIYSSWRLLIPCSRDLLALNPLVPSTLKQYLAATTRDRISRGFWNTSAMDMRDIALRTQISRDTLTNADPYRGWRIWDGFWPACVVLLNSTFEMTKFAVLLCSLFSQP